MSGSGPHPKAPRGRALVVDDNPLIRELIADFLQHMGLRVRVAPDGSTALAVFAGDRFDVLFVDFHMPGMTGLEVAAAVRKTDAQIPIILVTAQAALFAGDELSQTGISHVLPKPFTLNEIVACLRLTCITLETEVLTDDDGRTYTDA